MHSGLDQLLPRLLQMLGTAPHADARIAVLEALTAVADVPHEQTHSFRQPILKGLRSAMDDSKRDVRAVAVRCHGKWVSGS